MKILIVFATKYGTTGKCADLLGNMLKEKGHDVDIVDLRKNKRINPGEYSIAVIGGSFIMSRMNSEVKKFINRNIKKLISMKTGIFICGADENWEEEIKKGFPEKVLDSASVKAYFGFEMLWDKMAPFFRNMLQKEYKTTDNISRIKEDNIKKFAEEITRI